MKKLVTVAVLVAIALVGNVGGYTPTAEAAEGDLLATVDLANGTCNVGGTFTGTYYVAIQANGCSSSTLVIYTPPPGNGAATLESTKSVFDGAGAPVTISVVAWDPSRGKLWGAYAGQVWLIDIGDPTVDGNATATLEFSPGLGNLIDGLAWDAGDDTIYYSPDATCCVYQYSLGTGGNPPLGTLMNTVTSKDAGGTPDGLVSGVVVGSANTLYIGRDGAAEIRRIDKTTGDFISQFTTTAGRVEDLTCDPVTYAPLEAILSQDAFNQLYEAFEVEAGTCPLPSVGGIVSLLVDGSDSPASAADSSGSSGALYAALVGSIAAAAVALVGGGWYARRRWLR